MVPAEPYSAHHSIQQPYKHFYERRVDFCEGGEEFVCVWFIWEDRKGEYCAFTRKASATAAQEGSSPSPTISPA